MCIGSHGPPKQQTGPGNLVAAQAPRYVGPMTDMTNDRLAAETRNFIAEERKFIAEERKLGAEREKLFQEALKFERERGWYVPLALIGNGALAAVIGAVVAHLWK